jgi:hypothetical protein
MLTAEDSSNSFADVARLPNREHWIFATAKKLAAPRKSRYSYPTIRLPHTFSKLAGLPTRIYQTVHYEALAFLLVVSGEMATKNSAARAENAQINAKTPVLTWRRSPVRIRPSPLVFRVL